MFIDSPKVVDFKGDAVKLLMDYTEIYFGVKIENVSVILYKHSIDFITEAFKDITIQDIENSFKHSKIEKKQYTLLTIDELIDPIFVYFEKKKIVKNEIEKIKRLESEKLIQIQKEKQFKEDSKKMYIETLKTGIFKMNEFQCNCIAKNFKDSIDQNIKNEIWKKAQIEYKNRSKLLNQFELIPSAERIYSRMIIEECLKKGIKYIEE